MIPSKDRVVANQSLTSLYLYLADVEPKPAQMARGEPLDWLHETLYAASVS